MANNLNALGVSGTIFLIIVGVIVVSEIIKALTQVGGFLLDRYTGIKTQYTKKKEREELIIKNKEELDNFVCKQESFNQEIKTDLSDIHDTMKDVSDTLVQVQIQNMRTTILDFSSSVANGRVYTKEQFKYVRKLYEQYEEVIQKRGLTNDEVEISMSIINKAYSDRVLKKSFIEDRISDPGFQEKLKEVLAKEEGEEEELLNKDEKENQVKEKATTRKKN